MSKSQSILEPAAKAPVQSPPPAGPKPTSLVTYSKIRAPHLERLAIVYVRQSTPQQVLNNRESTARQYAFADQAVTYGWSRDRVLTIDEDLGKSGRTAEGRSGFQRLISEVGSNHVGLVLGLEMSRLARSSKDWHAFFELCAVFGTLIADQDGVYDGNDPNDRLLLGLKGIMSEMEMLTMRARLDRGSLNKAQRGDLFIHPPIGFVKSPDGSFILDPDEQARAVVQLIFDKFAEFGAASLVYKYLILQHIRIGVRPVAGPNRGQPEWRRACRTTVLNILRSPFYAGAYAYGRRRLSPQQKARGLKAVMPSRNLEDWRVLLHDRLPAYITWERYLEIQERLTQNRARWEVRGAPRNGPALLGGLIRCGTCGHRMTIEYRSSGNRPTYACHNHQHNPDAPKCPTAQGPVVDGLVTQQVLCALKPAALELSMQASTDVQRERQRQHQLWKQRLERAGYEAERAQRQYNAVEPENRLVARTLEQHWEQALCQQRELEEEYHRFARENAAQLNASERDRITSLAQDIPGLWNGPGTTPLDRQTIVRHLVADVVATARDESERMEVAIHWVGGYVSQHQMSRPVQGYAQLSRIDELRARVTELHLAGWTAPKIAEQLNQEEFGSARNGRFNAGKVGHLIRALGLSTLHEVHTKAKFLGPNEWFISDLARKLGILKKTLQRWRLRGWVHCQRMEGTYNRWLIWADQDELGRLRRLRDCRQRYAHVPHFPRELTTPKKRPKPSE